MTKTDQFDVAGYVRESLTLFPLKGYLQVKRIRHRTAQEERWGKGSIRTSTHHLNFVTSGCVSFRINGENIPLRRGMLLYTSSGCEEYYWDEVGEGFELITARFDVVMHDKDISPPRLPPQGCCFSVSPRDETVFLVLMEQLHASWECCPDPLAETAATCLLQSTLWAMREECFKSESESRDRLMEEARLRMDSDPEANWSIPDLAKQACLSQGHFSRRFRKHTGVPPKVYQRQSRMRHAYRLLQDEEMTVQEVADRLGYSDAFVFSRQFKKTWGISPSRV